jgi:hypothetical protein
MHYDKIDRAEDAAQSEHGRRPIALIAWRDYSHIAGSEIETARDEFIRAGIDEKVVQSEYRSAKKRYRAALRAVDDWDRKAGLSDLRKKYEDNRRETRAAWKALGEVRLTSITRPPRLSVFFVSGYTRLMSYLTTGKSLPS